MVLVLKAQVGLRRLRARLEGHGDLSEQSLEPNHQLREGDQIKSGCGRSQYYKMAD